MREEGPQGDLVLRTMAMPADTNPAGDIFGGWLMAQMDIAAGLVAGWRTHGRVATVAVDGMSFLKPVLVGDAVGCYGAVIHVGRTSLRIRIETWVRRGRIGDHLKVTEGTFTMVALDPNGRPRPVPRQEP